MKKKLLFLAIFLMFLFNFRVSAKESLICPKTANLGDVITCSYTFDKESRLIETDINYLSIDSITGEQYTKKNNYQVIFNSSGKVNFKTKKVGTVKVYVTMLSIDSSISEYTQIIVINDKTTTTKKTTTTRKKSSDNYLSSIRIDGDIIKDFDKNINKYYVTVPNNKEEVKITYNLNDDYSKAEINGPKKLEVGDNEYTIGVTSEDNTTRFYKILITRQETEKILSDNNKLSKLSIKNHKINFNKNINTYHLMIDKDTKKLNISVKVEDEKAKYKITGNNNLNTDSIIKIAVTAENGEINLYRIIINIKKNSIVPICIFIGTLIVLVIVIIILIKRKKGSNKKDNNKESEQDLEKTIVMTSLGDNVNKEIDDDNEKTLV